MARPDQEFREWLARVNTLCIQHFGCDVYHLPTTASFGGAFEEGATPEEFVAEIAEVVKDQSTTEPGAPRHG